MSTSNSNLNCVLCGVALTKANTANEHAILQCLGGRKESKECTCQKCNNDAGSTIDKCLCDCYFPVTASLSEFLPAESDVVGKRSATAVFPDGEREFRVKMPLASDSSSRGVYIGTSEKGGLKLVVGVGSESARSKAEEIGRAKFGEGGYHLEKIDSTCFPMHEHTNIHFPDSIVVQCAVLKVGLLALASLGADLHRIDVRTDTFAIARNTIHAAMQAVRSISPTGSIQPIANTVFRLGYTKNYCQNY